VENNRIDPIHVFIDSNVFIRFGFNFKSRPLLSLKMYSRLGHIKAVITEVNYREVIQHFKEHLLKIHINIEKLIRDLMTSGFDGQENLERLQELYCSTNRSKMIETGLMLWDDYINSCGIEILPIQNIDVKSILEKHFNLEPPFSEKKRHEFKDAFILDILAKFIDVNNIQLHIVTADNDYSLALKSDSIAIHGDIQSVLSLINEEYYKDSSRMISNFILSQSAKDKINDNIEGILLTDCSYDLLARDEVSDYDLDDAHINGYTIFSIENIDVDSAYASILLNVNATLSFSYECLDPETAYWDQEENRYYYTHTIDVKATHNVEKLFRVEINLGSNDEPLELDIDNIEPYEKKTISLYEDSLVKRHSSLRTELDSDSY